MEKYVYDESNNLWYERQGDYCIPCLSLSEEEEQPIGLWGQRHLQYIREYRKALYKMAQAQSVTETLKAADPMVWMRWMNNICSAAVEIISTEIIYFKCNGGGDIRSHRCC